MLDLRVVLAFGTLSSSLAPINRSHHRILTDSSLRRNRRRGSRLGVLRFFGREFDELIGDAVGRGLELDEARGRGKVGRERGLGGAVDERPCGFGSGRVGL